MRNVILKNFKLLSLYLLLVFVIIPFNVYAYSDKIVVGGENIGITLNSDGIIVVGLYETADVSPGKEAGIIIGDVITSINNKHVDNISDMAEKITVNDTSSIKIGYLRNGKNKETTLNLTRDENGVYKTGLYVKDSITGIGTLTYIDPETKIFGALGHEIEEQTTGELLEIKDGKIFTSTVNGVIPSTDGNPGEKKAEYNINDVAGNVTSNTTEGIFGKYTKDIKEDSTYEVAKSDEVKLGKAEVLTVLEGNEIENFEINIISINENKKQKNKNFIFEITDEKLLAKTGGIIQGMSGSPIIQNNKIIGAVTHVVVDSPHKGYGIFITNMLEEGEK